MSQYSDTDDLKGWPMIRHDDRLILLGVYEDESAEYYRPPSEDETAGAVIRYDSDNDRAVAEQWDEGRLLEIEEHSAHDSVNDIVSVAVDEITEEFLLTPVGEFLYLSSDLSAGGAITERQALAYLLRDILGVPREEAATILGTSVSAYDNTVHVVRKKIEYWRRILKKIDQLS